MLDTRNQEEHTWTRKALVPFFSNDNVRTVVEKLAQTVADACAKLEAQAREATDRSVTVNMVAAAFGIIDHIVQIVRCCREGLGLGCWPRGATGACMLLLVLVLQQQGNLKFGLCPYHHAARRLASCSLRHCFVA